MGDKDKSKKGEKRRKEKVKCLRGVCDPQRSQGSITDVSEGEHTLVELEGPGLFVAAQVSKQGGSNDVTFVSLDIDGRSVTNLSFAAARNMGLTRPNPFGLVLLRSGTIRNLTIGFPTPLRFSRSLALGVNVNEADIDQIVGSVIHGSI